MKYYHELFNNYRNYHKLKNGYPPFFSKLIKYYTVTAMSEDIRKCKSVREILRIAEKITGENR